MGDGERQADADQDGDVRALRGHIQTAGRAEAEVVDLIDITTKLRELLGACDVAEDALSSSFTSTDPELEALASQLRPTAHDLGALTYKFLDRLENTRGFVRQRAATLKRRRTP